MKIGYKRYENYKGQTHCSSKMYNEFNVEDKMDKMIDMEKMLIREDVISRFINGHNYFKIKLDKNDDDYKLTIIILEIEGIIPLCVNAY